MDKPILAVVAVACAVAAIVWGRSARYLRKVELRLEHETGAESDATVLARSQFRKELHTAAPLRRRRRWPRWPVSFSEPGRGRRPLRLRAHPGRHGARLRPRLHPRGPAVRGPGRASSAGPRRCSPRRSWRPSGGPSGSPPTTCPPIPGFEIGRVYQPGTGLLAGDFYDVYPLSPRPARRGDRRRHRPRHRAVDHRLPGQGPPAGVPPRVPRPGPGARGAQPADVAARPARGVRVDPRRRVRHRGRHGALRVGRAPAGLAVARPRGAPAAGHRAAAAARPRRRLPLAARCRSTPTTSCSSTPTGWPRPATARRSSARSASARCCAATPASHAQVLCKSLVEAARDFSSTPITDDIAILAVRDSDSLAFRLPMEDIAAAAERALQGNLHKEAREARPPGQAVRPRPARPAARRGLVRRGRPAGQRHRPSDLPGRRRRHRHRARSTAGRCA